MPNTSAVGKVRATRHSAKSINRIESLIGGGFEFEYHDDRLIYFIEQIENDISTVKIGLTTEQVIRSRMVNLQNGNPNRLVLIGTIPGSNRVESILHTKFKKYRIHGEWFDLTGALKRFVWSVFYEK